MIMQLTFFNVIWKITKYNCRLDNRPVFCQKCTSIIIIELLLLLNKVFFIIYVIPLRNNTNLPIFRGLKISFMKLRTVSSPSLRVHFQLTFGFHNVAITWITFWNQLEVIPILTIFDHPPTHVDKIFTPEVDKIWTILDHLPTPSCPRSYWMTP